jgi:hypothetical protein
MSLLAQPSYNKVKCAFLTYKSNFRPIFETAKFCSVTYLLRFYFCITTSTKTHERYLHILISYVDEPSNPMRSKIASVMNSSYGILYLIDCLKTPFSYACRNHKFDQTINFYSFKVLIPKPFCTVFTNDPCVLYMHCAKP